MIKAPSLHSLSLLLLLSFVLWYFTFNVELFSFWSKLLLSSFILAFIAVLSGGEIMFKLNKYEGVLVVWVAILSYILFWILDFIASFLPFLREGIEAVYELASGINPFVLGIFLVVIAICEEIFWRGYVSEFLLRKLDVLPAILLASGLYSVVHVFTLNLSLVFGAFVLGLVMNTLYLLTGKVSSTIYVHAIWAVLVFLIFPLA